MKTHIKFAVVCCVWLMACQSEKSNLLEKFDAVAERNMIADNMEEQEKSWNEANVESFMKHYWLSDSLCFIGKRGLSYGWKTTRDNYLKSYPDATAMGTLRFTNERIDVLDAKNAFVIGKWELLRTADTLSGHYSLLWKKIQGKWFIVADHSS
jgi:ketosteroid isomerase-like protein